jgi:glycosyltransferase involved in cell wall biosynthesis
MKLSCIIPAYNESSHIFYFIDELCTELKKISNDFEVIIINDGSQDNTSNVIFDNYRNNLNIKYIEFTRNFGKEAAITAGLNNVKGDLCFIMDADFQHPFLYLHKMINIFNQGYDMVYCYVSNRDHDSYLFGKLKEIFYKYIFSPDKIVIPHNAGDFRLLSRDVIDCINSMNEKNRYMKGIYSWVGFKSIGIEYVPNDRKSGQSNFSFPKLFGLALEGITSFSIKPLIIATILGLIICFLSFLYALYIIFDTIFLGNPTSGWPSLIVSLMFFSGLNLFFMGLIGIYIGKIFTESKNRPIYLINNRKSFNI